MTNMTHRVRIKGPETEQEVIDISMEEEEEAKNAPTEENPMERAGQQDQKHPRNNHCGG